VGQREIAITRINQPIPAIQVDDQRQMLEFPPITVTTMVQPPRNQANIETATI
jgi:hypothetical protein